MTVRESFVYRVFYDYESNQWIAEQRLSETGEIVFATIGDSEMDVFTRIIG